MRRVVNRYVLTAKKLALDLLIKFRREFHGLEELGFLVRKPSVLLCGRSLEESWYMA